VSLLGEKSAEIGASLARQLDEILGECIKQHIPGPLDLPALKGRLSAVSFTTDPKRGTTYLLDNRPLVTVYPIVVEMVGFTVTATQKYQRHHSEPEPSAF
jgi:hypothetical protein